MWGGDSIDEVIAKYVAFQKNKKLYTYAVKREDPDYTTVSSPLDVLNPNKENKKDNKKG